MVAASTNVAFEIEAVANADGDWEIVNVECEPTTEVTNKGRRQARSMRAHGSSASSCRRISAAMNSCSIGSLVTG
jgi:hypothetical protein